MSYYTSKVISRVQSRKMVKQIVFSKGMGMYLRDEHVYTGVQI